jgi:hypothetical protein
MTPRRWYLAAVVVLAIIVAAVVELATMSRDSKDAAVVGSRLSDAPQTPSGTPTPSPSASSPPVTSSPVPEPSTSARTSPAPRPSPSPRPRPSPVPDLAPSSLAIPALDVVAPIDMCAIVDGGLQPPADLSRTCYWAGGARVGAHTGTTVITGQCDVCGSDRAALSRIVRLHAGDTLFTAGTRARVTRWRVTDVIYRPKSSGILPDAFVGRDGPRRLYLVSAGGPYTAGEYVDNVYVRAVPSAD